MSQIGNRPPSIKPDDPPYGLKSSAVSLFVVVSFCPPSKFDGIEPVRGEGASEVASEVASEGASEGTCPLEPLIGDWGNNLKLRMKTHNGKIILSFGPFWGANFRL